MIYRFSLQNMSDNRSPTLLGSREPNPERSSGDVIVDIRLMSKQAPNAQLVLGLARIIYVTCVINK